MGKELTVIDIKNYALAQLDPATAIEAIRDLVGEIDIRTDLTTLPGVTPGGKSWDVVHPTGEVEELKSVTGVIIARRPTRAYYTTAYEPGAATEPPYCSAEPNADHEWFGNSEDRKYHGRNCAACEHNVFGTAANGKGKACSEYVSLIMYRQDDALLPINVRVPPAALKHLKNYTMGLLNLGILKLHDAVTEVSLEPVKGAPPTWKFRLVGKVDGSMREHLIARAGLFAATAKPVAVGSVTDSTDDGEAPF